MNTSFPFLSFMNITPSFNKKSYSGGGVKFRFTPKKQNLTFFLGFAPATFWPLNFRIGWENQKNFAIFSFLIP